MGDRLGKTSAVGLNIFYLFLFAHSIIQLEENEQIPVIKSANGHTTLNAPVLVRSLKLSNFFNDTAFTEIYTLYLRDSFPLNFLISFYLHAVSFNLKKMNKFQL